MSNQTSTDFHNATDFHDSYVEATLWANTYDLEMGEPVEHTGELVLSIGAAETLSQDVADFLTPQVERLVRAAGRRVSGYDFSQAGHDFALTRNHHGAGFWDRGLGMVGDALTALAHNQGQRNLYVVDDIAEVE